MEPAASAVYVVLCFAVLCCAVLCCAVLYCAVLCCAVLCCAVLCCAVLCCAPCCAPWCAQPSPATSHAPGRWGCRRGACAPTPAPPTPASAATACPSRTSRCVPGWGLRRGGPRLPVTPVVPLRVLPGNGRPSSVSLRRCVNVLSSLKRGSEGQSFDWLCVPGVC